MYNLIILINKYIYLINHILKYFKTLQHALKVESIAFEK